MTKKSDEINKSNKNDKNRETFVLTLLLGHPHIFGKYKSKQEFFKKVKSYKTKYNHNAIFMTVRKYKYVQCIRYYVRVSPENKWILGDKITRPLNNKQPSK